MKKISLLTDLIKGSMKAKFITGAIIIVIVTSGAYLVMKANEGAVAEPNYDNQEVTSLEEITGSKEKAEEIVKINESNDPEKTIKVDGNTAPEETSIEKKEIQTKSSNKDGGTTPSTPNAPSTTETQNLAETQKPTENPPTTTIDNNYSSFTYDWNIGRNSGYMGGNNDYASMFNQLSSKSTYSAFVSEVNKAVQVVTQGAYVETVKAKFLNKVYNGKTITNVEFKYYTVPFMDNGEMVTDQYPYLQKQGVENFSGPNFSTVLACYGLVSDNGELSRFVQCTVYFN